MRIISKRVDQTVQSMDNKQSSDALLMKREKVGKQIQKQLPQQCSVFADSPLGRIIFLPINQPEFCPTVTTSIKIYPSSLENLNLL